MMQDQTQQRIANHTIEVLQAGISTDSGLYGVLQNGTFLEDLQSPPEAEALNGYERIVSLRLLAAVLKSQVRLMLAFLAITVVLRAEDSGQMA